MTLKKLAFSAAILLALGAGATWLRASARTSAAEAAYPPEGQFVTVMGRRMHAVVMGDGPDLVLIHGSSGSTRDMTFALAPALAAHYRVIAIDRPGLGWSDPDPDGYLLARQAELMQATAAALGADRPLVLGQSYGGAVALAWALDHPDHIAGLITVSSPAYPWPTGLGALYTITSNPIGQYTAIPLIAAWLPEGKLLSEVAGVFAPQAMPDGYADYFGPRMSLRPAAARANAVQRRELLAQITEMTARYPSIDMPVEILHGTADTTVDLDIHAIPLSEAVPGAVLTRLPGIGHMPHNVDVPAVVAAVDRVARRAGLRADD